MGNFESYEYTEEYPREYLVKCSHEELVEICGRSPHAAKICEEHGFWAEYCSYWDSKDKQAAFEAAIKNNHYNIAMILCYDEDVDIHSGSGYAIRYCKENGMDKMYNLLVQASAHREIVYSY